MSTVQQLGRGLIRRNSVSVTFTGAANLGQSGTATTLFTTTGEVLIVYLVPFSVLTPVSAGAGTLALGVTNSTSLFIATTTIATTLATGEFWTENTGGGTAEAGVALPAGLKDIAISSNILLSAAIGDVTGGTLRFDAYWLPLSSNGALT
jgi:hypothetical protein